MFTEKNLMCFFCFLLHEEGEEFDAGYATFEQNMSGLC
jgi:hypothetical protein